MTKDEVLLLVQQEHNFWKEQRLATMDFREKNLIAMSEAACEQILRKIKYAEIYPNE